MADNDSKSSNGQNPAAPGAVDPAMAAAAANLPMLQIVAQYVKDMSFENPGVGKALNRPKMELGVDVSANAMPEENTFEALLKIRVTATQDERPIFLLELSYGGLFQLRNIPKENLEPVLLIECPRLLFPFARRVIADAIRDGGLPPVMLDPIDFATLYQARRNRSATASPPTATV